MNDHVISLVKELSRGPCSCTFPMSMASTGYHDPSTGAYFPGVYEEGPKLECMRCRARRCLEEDGIPYEKDDRVQWSPLLSMGFNGAAYAGGGVTACKSFIGTVVTGTLGVLINAQ